MLNLLSVSGRVEWTDELVEVRVLTDGGRRGKPSPRMAAVWATHAPGSMGLTGSVRGIVKYPFGFGSQHFATTNLIGLRKRNFVHKVTLPKRSLKRFLQPGTTLRVERYFVNGGNCFMSPGPLLKNCFQYKPYPYTVET